MLPLEEEEEFFFSYYGGKPVKAALHPSALRFKLVSLRVEVVGDAGRDHPQEQEAHPGHLCAIQQLLA